MRHIALTAALATGLLASPLATSGEAFVNGQLGRIALDSKTLDKDSSNLLQLGGGYRWGIGPVKAGVEAGFGRIGEVSGGNDADGDSRAFDLGANHYSIGANARIKPPLLPVQFIARAGYIGMRNTLEQTVTAPATGNTTRATDKHTSGGTYLGAGIGTTLLPLLD
ncbi:MAG: outer membrane beta-barrel protein, partial [Pseudoxanthomonas suwonensis]|nr:outer membrane beta-barrel protein [Pseudoxanthomonas suwonensis]